MITLYHLDRNAFSQDDLRILEAASLQIGPAIEAALRFQDAKESAATDHLTGVPNARALALHLTQELQRAGRDQSRVGVLVCDLDGFKQVNDRFGHLKGNEVLQCVAKGLRETCRGSDYVARMGGDEFVIVVPDFPADYSPQLERLRAAAVAAGEIVSDEPCLSMSVGVAIFPADGRDVETLLAKADKRMYQLKRRSKSEGGAKEGREIALQADTRTISISWRSPVRRISSARITAECLRGKTGTPAYCSQFCSCTDPPRTPKRHNFLQVPSRRAETRHCKMTCLGWSGRGDLNARPPAPKEAERAPFPVGTTHILKALLAIVHRESRAL